MEIGPITRYGTPPPAPAPAAAPVAAAAPVRTELPRQAVDQPPPAMPAGDEAGDRAAATDIARQHELSIDPGTQSLVSRVFDGRTGELLSQVPDVALLRMRAYARAALAELESRGSGRVARIA